MGAFDFFSLRLFIIREQSISFNFFNHSKKLITFVLKNIVHGKSIISLIFSVNDCLVKSLALILWTIQVVCPSFFSTQISFINILFIYKKRCPSLLSTLYRYWYWCKTNCYKYKCYNHGKLTRRRRWTRSLCSLDFMNKYAKCKSIHSSQ